LFDAQDVHPAGVFLISHSRKRRNRAFSRNPTSDLVNVAPLPENYVRAGQAARWYSVDDSASEGVGRPSGFMSSRAVFSRIDEIGFGVYRKRKRELLGIKCAGGGGGVQVCVFFDSRSSRKRGWRWFQIRGDREVRLAQIQCTQRFHDPSSWRSWCEERRLRNGSWMPAAVRILAETRGGGGTWRPFARGPGYRDHTRQLPRPHRVAGKNLRGPMTRFLGEA